ncbi:uncharacterized protein [Tenebrio molitor]|uniref:uncharacterized protein isoform X2 n=1 Tax=Tenebrio molitor TaxID=7067 RepID=UPI003624AA40
MADFKLLKLTCRIGKFFAITPSCDATTTDSVKFKCYRVLLIGLVAAGLTTYAVQEYLYGDSHNISAILLFLDNIVLYGTNMYIMVALGFWKRRSWSDLIQNLKSNKDLVHEEAKSICTRLLVPNLIEIAILVVQAVTSALTVQGLEEMKRTSLHFLQWYLQFFNKFLLYVLVKMLRARYRGLKHQLSTSFLHKNHDLTFLVKQVGAKIYSLKKCVDIYNEVFGWLMVLIISFATLEVLKWIPVIILLARGKAQVQASLLAGILNTSFHFVSWCVSGFDMS